jgi:hypothetical protein
MIDSAPIHGRRHAHQIGTHAASNGYEGVASPKVQTRCCATNPSYGSESLATLSHWDNAQREFNGVIV